MGRYTGPVCRLCRREGEKLFLKGDRCITAKCAISRKKNVPGASARKRRGKLSYFGQQLREKQKLKRFYGVSESQFRKYYDMASRTQGNTGELLFQFVERRLDNIVCRLGFASSRKQARQLIVHGHFTLDGKKASIPSMQVKKGSVVKVKEGAKNFAIVDENLKRETVLPNWLQKTDEYTGTVLELPLREDFQDIQVKEQMIIELYSK